MGREIWKDVPEFEGYQVSNKGRVRSRLKPVPNAYKKGAAVVLKKEWHSIKTNFDPDGYLCCGLSRKGKQYIRRVHRLVLESFIGCRPEGLVACHNNSIRDDNRVENLRWDTIRSNEDDKIKFGRCKGTNNGNAKLSEKDVLYLRSINPKPRGREGRKIARQFGINYDYLKILWRNIHWKHLL